MQNMYFTSDMHFGHKNIIKFSNRPYSDVIEMREMLIQNWNSVVKRKSDVVYVLGDFSFLSVNNTIEILERLNGQKHLIMGNHDNHKFRNQLKEHLIWVKDYMTIKIPPITEYRGGRDYSKAVLFHYPIASWEQVHHGAIHLHGHSHGNFTDPHNRRTMDVGVDTNNYFPYSMDQIEAVMKTKTFVSVDHHA
jgi:calcineurin-like phosphoesterase family protein